MEVRKKIKCSFINYLPNWVVSVTLPGEYWCSPGKPENCSNAFKIDNRKEKTVVNSYKVKSIKLVLPLGIVAMFLNTGIFFKLYGTQGLITLLAWHVYLPNSTLKPVFIRYLKFNYIREKPWERGCLKLYANEANCKQLRRQFRRRPWSRSTITSTASFFSEL